MRLKRAAGGMILLASVSGIAYSVWLIYLWYAINAVFFWQGPVYSFLALPAGLIGISAAAAAWGYKVVAGKAVERSE